MYYITKEGSAVTWRTEGDRKATKKEYERQVILKDGAQLKAWFGDNPRVAVTVTQVASTGVTRHMLVQTIVDGRIKDITSYVASVLKWRLARFNRVLVTGCGMDMCHALVDNLSWALYGKGDQIQQH